jgi:hypothetical protein
MTGIGVAADAGGAGGACAMETDEITRSNAASALNVINMPDLGISDTSLMIYEFTN